jgi:hypothetical protein
MKWKDINMSVKVAQMLRPFNKGFSAFQIKLVMNDLVYRYVQNIKNKIKIRIYKENEDYFIYAKIPSESNSEYPDSSPIFYDIIIQLIPPNKASLAWDNIREYDAKVFSNIPSFVYTFNYIYHQKRALVNLPSMYYTHRALNEKAKIRNPLNLLGIDKSLWFTIYHIDYNKLFKKANIDTLVEENLNTFNLLKDEKIMTQDRKVDECERREKHRRDLKEAENKKKKRSAFKSKTEPKIVRNQEALALFSDLSSNLHSERFKAESMEGQLTSTLNKGIVSKNQSKEDYQPSTLRSNLKSSSLKSSL